MDCHDELKSITESISSWRQSEFSAVFLLWFSPHRPRYYPAASLRSVLASDSVRYDLVLAVRCRNRRWSARLSPQPSSIPYSYSSISHAVYRAVHPLLPNSNPCPTPNGVWCGWWCYFSSWRSTKEGGIEGGREGREEQSSSDKRRHKLRSTRLSLPPPPPPPPPPLAVAQAHNQAGASSSKLGEFS